MNKKPTLSSTFKLFIDAPSQLGELFLKAGFITQAQLDEVAKASQYVPARLGQMCVMLGYVNHTDLQNALQLQCLLREKIIEKPVGIQALKLTRHRKIELRDALLELESRDRTEPSTRLGDLLVEASIVTEQQLEEALTCNQSSGLPLGRILVLSGALTDQVLVAALNAQMLLRQGTIQRLDAIRAIIASTKRKTSTPNTMSPNETLKLPPRESFLEDLLVHAEIVTQQDFERAVRTAIDVGTGVGAALVHLGLVDIPTLEMAREMQRLVEDKFLSRAWCIQSLREICNDREAKGADAECAPPVKDKDKAPQVEVQSRTPPNQPKEFSLPEFLVLCKVDNASETEVLDLVSLCFNLIQNERLSLDEAVFAFDFCNRRVNETNSRLIEAAEILGFTSGIWAVHDSLSAND